MRVLLTVVLCSCTLKVDDKSTPAPPARVVVVDLQRALSASREGAAAKARLMEVYKKSQRELDDEQSRIKREQELGIGKAPGGMEEMQRRLLALQQKYTALQSGLNDAEQKESGAILQRMNETLAAMAKEKGWDVVLDRQSAPYARAELDVTDDLVSRFDARDGG